MNISCQKKYNLLKQYFFCESEDYAVLHHDIDQWIEEVSSFKESTYEKGIVDMGWLVAYLIEENVIDGDQDDILADIDDSIYKLTIRESVGLEYDIQTLLDLMTYYQQRFLYNSKAPFYRRFSLFECMKLLVQKLNDYLDRGNDLNWSQISSKIKVLLKYSFLIKINFPEKLLEKAFYNSIENLLEKLEGNKCEAWAMTDLLKLQICICQYQHPHWQERIRRIIAGMPTGTVESCWEGFLNHSLSGQGQFLFPSRKVLQIFQDEDLYELTTNIKF